MTTAKQPRPTLLRLDDTDRTIASESEDVRGRTVVDAAGEKLGKVSHLLVDDQARHVRFLLVEHGGILGIGAVASYIPVEAVAGVDEHNVIIDSDAQEIAGAPGYDPDIAAADDYFDDLSGYYGYQPYWAGAGIARFPFAGPRG